MKELIDGVWTWARFSEEKGYDFNGYFLCGKSGSVLIDPVPFSVEDADEMARLGAPRLVIITNKDHRRACEHARERFSARVLTSAADAPLMDVPVDATFRDGEMVGGFLEAIVLDHMKSPGETALYWAERRLLFLGDALIGKEPGRLSLLPPAKVPEPALAKRSLRRLLEKDVDAVFVGDGVSVLADARRVMAEALQ